ncbi:helix-turn-helix domain-containing protein [Chitinophaga polysaccharea]|uniref:helix-turn-helix domain-containing protein n=1 Tax=Chitinophaga polysaccharea TaxID=1293035 RepID=UPI001455DB65|nr:helix-turn-helix transcriptional regulator [Chitinophaga polysaccharea]NLR59388.1 helix-turn-helix domain-containing protein [Chitinophaga polysaccharea]
MGTQFGLRVKELREVQGLLQRQVAALLEIDTPLYSKIERGERIAKKEVAVHLASILKADERELLTLWLADQVYDVIKNEQQAGDALKAVSKKLKSKI